MATWKSAVLSAIDDYRNGQCGGEYFHAELDADIRRRLCQLLYSGRHHGYHQRHPGLLQGKNRLGRKSVPGGERLHKRQYHGSA